MRLITEVVDIYNDQLQLTVHCIIIMTFQQGRILVDKGVQGLLCLKNPIPGMGRSIVGKRNFKDGYFNYFPKYPGKIIHILYTTSSLHNLDTFSHGYIEGSNILYKPWFYVSSYRPLFHS